MEPTSNESYYRMLAALASGLTGLRVSVVDGARTASINVVTKSIVVPKSWTAFGGNAFIGMILHEAYGHGKRTVPISELRINQSHVLRAMWNVLEDVRIELGAATDWPAAKALLNECSTAVVTRLMPNPATLLKSSVKPESLLINTMLCVGRSRFLGQDAWNGHAKMLKRKFEKVFGLSGMQALENAMTETVHAPLDKSGTAVVERITLELFDALNKKNNASNNSDDAANESGSSNNSSSSTGGQPPMHEQPGTDEPEAKADASSSASEAGLNGNPEMGADEIGEGEDPESSSAETSGTDAGFLDEAVDISQTGELTDAFLSAGRIRKQVNTSSRVSNSKKPCHPINDYSWLTPMARRAMEPLRELLIAMTLTGGLSYSSRGASLDMGRAMLSRANGPEVFSRKNYGEEVSTAISVVVDVSGSMSHDWPIDAEKVKAAQAIQMVAALSAATIEIANEADVPINVISYSDRAIETRSFDQARGNVEFIGEGTVLAEGLCIAFKRLAERPEARKIVLILTDGQTEGNDECVAILNGEVTKMLGFIPIVLQIGANFPLGKQLAHHGHLVAVANTFTDLCNETGDTLSRALNLHPA